MNKVLKFAAMAVVALVCVSGAQSAHALVTCFGIPDTDPGVCSGHGVCIAPDTCGCYVGYVGLQCQTATCFGIPDTDPAVCSGHGVCIAANTCSCQAGFVGNACESLVIPTVTVGNAGNTGELSGEGAGGNGPDRVCGAVDYVYRIGKFEVTAGQYTEFLNAVAKTDTYGLYNTSMWSSSYGCKIERTGSSPNFSYSVAADWADRPVDFVSWGDAVRFCNWLHNGQPTGAQSLGTTEDGSYYLNGATSNTALLAVVREPDATWVIPSEDEWYKAAYHKNDGVTENYFDYPTSSDSLPGYVNNSGNLSGTGTPFIEGGTDPGNYATYDGDDVAWGIGSPYYRTKVGEWENSESPYGSFDQGGNVWEWNEANLYGSSRGLRGGAFYYAGAYYLRAADRYFDYPTNAYSSVGFRVAEVSEQAPIPTVSEWGVVTMALLVLTAGTLVLARRRVASV